MSLPVLHHADASFVTSDLLVGGDLHTHDDATAQQQVEELVEAGVTHFLDTRVEWSDEAWVAAHQPGLQYLHHGIDDAGQRVPAYWFETGVAWALDALGGGGRVLAHCHMGVNRGPSLGFAILLGQGWDPVEALEAVRRARPVAWVAYAEDALVWHHERRGSTDAELEVDRRRLTRWRAENELDLAAVIRAKRRQGW